MRPEVVLFLEAQARPRATAVISRARADRDHRLAVDEFDRAWEALTEDERELVNDACRGLQRLGTNPRPEREA